MLYLICTDDALLPQAHIWCDTYGLTLAGAEQLQQPGFHLCLDDSGLSLRSGENPKSAVQVDFSSGAVAHRRKFGGGMGQVDRKSVV